MDDSLQAIFNAAQDALKNDARQTILNGAQARQNAFAQLNNAANANHMLFSGRPKVSQMQYDAKSFIPDMSSAVVKAVQNQAENQEKWDQFASAIKEMNDQAASLEAAVGGK